MDELVLDLPPKAVFGEAHMKLGPAIAMIGAEYSCEAALPGHDRRVIDTGAAFRGIPPDDRIGAMSPQNCITA
jgi:hypothetical protein